LGIPLPFTGEFEVVIMIERMTEEMHFAHPGRRRAKRLVFQDFDSTI
jgi:hypothetical protein